MSHMYLVIRRTIWLLVKSVIVPVGVWVAKETSMSYVVSKEREREQLLLVLLLGVEAGVASERATQRENERGEFERSLRLAVWTQRQQQLS